MAKVKEVKLTATQQEVVNLMADGWTLENGFGIREHQWLWLCKKGNANRDLRLGLHSQLKAKGVVEMTGNDWKRHIYSLTDLGRSLVKEVAETPSEVWWRTLTYTTDVVRVVCKSSTDATVTLENDRKESKCTGYHSYHATRNLAIKSIRDRLMGDVREAEQKTKQARQSLAKFEQELTTRTEGDT